MIDEGKRDSDEYRTIQAQMINIRAEYATASFDALKKSILELLAYAEPLGISLGLENRYHYLEHPSPDELQNLLDLASPRQIGFIYDIGHAETLDCLGFIRAANGWNALPRGLSARTCTMPSTPPTIMPPAWATLTLRRYVVIYPQMLFAPVNSRIPTVPNR